MQPTVVWRWWKRRWRPSETMPETLQVMLAKEFNCLRDGAVRKVSEWGLTVDLPPGMPDRCDKSNLTSAVSIALNSATALQGDAKRSVRRVVILLSMTPALAGVDPAGPVAGRLVRLNGMLERRFRG